MFLLGIQACDVTQYFFAKFRRSDLPRATFLAVSCGWTLSPSPDVTLLLVLLIPACLKDSQLETPVTDQYRKSLELDFPSRGDEVGLTSLASTVSLSQKPKTGRVIVAQCQRLTVHLIVSCKSHAGKMSGTENSPH
jgi:hypothetical protein